MIILVDFDGTCVTHEYPKIGKSIGAEPVLRDLVEAGHKLILWTMRSWTSFGDRKDASVLQEAVEWFKERDIPLYGINENPDQHSWTTSPKAYGHICIDDNCLGVPLKGPNLLSHRPYVNWDAVRLALTERNILPKVSE